MRHATDGTQSSDRAPIFHQFIETVWQLVQQFPMNFEFNEKFLIVLLDELYACKFGTFLFDCEKERVEAETHTKTPSLWGYILDRRVEFTNPIFKPADQVLIASSSSRLIRLWELYYFRHHQELATRSWTSWDFLTAQPTAVNASPVASSASAAAAPPSESKKKRPAKAKAVDNRAKDDSAVNTSSARLRSMTTTAARNGTSRADNAKKPTSSNVNSFE